ncbi:Uncharacterized membrane protein YsdA, DUF1294 family [Parasporobacterium paucivorans DSM 15970]|uniref:Uncharacterized membrane protein YsdA, DUF1294 family n=2 Tax=Parasporobacterium TaxID=115543 RepID=A0A1M6C4L0_9FIRM|nr:Uncharacterized membrane protein YsdA, DUF1294 family [Parasporobacterium paucivorans DSM 15970]
MIYKMLILYLLLINMTGIILIALDKRKARFGQWRIPERTLFLSALVGGSPGVWVAMKIFHHKTRHMKFVLGIPAILAFQVIAVLLFHFYQF